MDRVTDAAEHRLGASPDGGCDDHDRVATRALHREDLDRELPHLARLALRQTAVAILLLTPGGRILFANSAAASLVGRLEHEVLGMVVSDLGDPDDVAAGIAAMARLRSGECDSYRRIGRYLHRDGGIVHVDVAASAVRDDHGGLTAVMAFVVDVSEHEKARHQADEARERMHGAIDSLLDPWVYLLAVRDEDDRIVDFEYVDANAAACTANRCTRDELVGMRLLELLPAHAENGLLQRYAEVVETGIPLALDDSPYPSELTGGGVRWFDNRAVRVGDGLSFTWRDVTDRVLQRQRLAAQASTDALTGLSNRQHLMDTMSLIFQGVPRAGHGIAVLYCDLDGLKWLNDTHGHEFGDVVLRSVADRMVGAVRSQDLVARIGGDEFVVVAEGVTDDEAAAAIAAKIAAAVTRPVTHAGITVLPTLSIGVSLSAPGDDATRALRMADQALYRQKSRGRGDQMRLELT